jgi:hypothetical protein
MKRSDWRFTGLVAASRDELTMKIPVTVPQNGIFGKKIPFLLRGRGRLSALAIEAGPQ